MNEPMTLAEIAKAEGVSHQYIAEILARALNKVRIRLSQLGYKSEDLL